MRKLIPSILCLFVSMITFAQTGVDSLHSTFAKAQSVTFYNVNLVDVEKGEIVPGMTIEIEEGIITKISKSGKRLKKGQLDLSGKYLMPGLIDSHTHWGAFGAVGNIEDLAKSYLADGVTTVRDAGTKMSYMKRYKEQLENGKIVGPTVYASSFWIGPQFPCRDEEISPWYQVVSDTMTTERLEQLIVEAKEYGCTGLKLYNDISYELLKRIVPLCHKHDMKPWGHFATLPATAMEVVQAGVETVSHAYMIDGIDGWREEVKNARFSPEKRAAWDSLYREMVRRGTILDATTVVSVRGGSNLDGSTVYTREAYQAGVKIAAGTDFVDGYNSIFLQELNFLADSCGMSLPDVLRAATVVGAEVVGQSGKIGVIRQGAEADLLILSENPLKSLSALRKQEGLYINGKQVR